MIKAGPITPLHQNYADCIDELFDLGDNVVEFLSQIGCTSTGTISPDKKIDFERIFVNIDSNGGNSYGSHLHSKMPHREVVMEQVYEYLTGNY